MPEVVVKDRIRGVSDRYTVHNSDSVDRTISRLIHHFGLPRQDFKRQTLTYWLGRPGPEDDPENFPGHRPVGEVGLRDNDTLWLSSPDAGAVWTEISRLVDEVNDELRLQVTTWSDEATAEVRSEVSTGLTAIRSEIDQEVRERLEGAAAKVPFWRRLRARWKMRRLAKTGALSEEVAGVRIGLSQLSTAASYAVKATPFVVGATMVATGAGAVAAADDDSGADDTGGRPPVGTEVLVMTEADLEALLEANADRIIDAQISDADIEAAVRAAIEDQESDVDVTFDVDAFAAAVAAQLPELIRREVPGAEQDGVTSASLGDVSRSSPIRSVELNDTLWAIAVDAQANPDRLGCDPGPFEESVAVYVRRIWAANAGSFGGDPDQIDPIDEIRVPCPE